MESFRYWPFFSKSVLIRNYAVSNLKFLLKKMGVILSDKKNLSRYKESMKESALVSAGIDARPSVRLKYGAAFKKGTLK
ncbi:uncharacterized protein TOL2_C39390 [Desulfobacula toluolica Tol2]|uniref:Uncharacterized protein n=1 Tax=Desulfobacula toluolica (strain DSM 7467 / Tol2) TaxID=651182 RepID=K0NNA7_DESTT|nr:uncharacterized protein TOL2_C39390 [Desulfobacula toluolica Tol2]